MDVDQPVAIRLDQAVGHNLHASAENHEVDPVLAEHFELAFLFGRIATLPEATRLSSCCSIR